MIHLDPVTVHILQMAVTDAMDDAPLEWRRAAMLAFRDAQAAFTTDPVPVATIPLIGTIR